MDMRNEYEKDYLYDVTNWLIGEKLNWLQS